MKVSAFYGQGSIFLSLQHDGGLVSWQPFCFSFFLFLIFLERKSACFEDEESELFIEVDCFNVEPVLCPAPEGLSQQQVLNIQPVPQFIKLVTA